MLIGGKPVARTVKVGVKDEVNAQILEGLEAGDQVIVGATGTTAASGSGSGTGGGKGKGKGAGSDGGGQ